MSTDLHPTLPDAHTAALVQALYMRHAEVICDDQLEAWPELYADDCNYRLISRVNHDRKLPLAVILAESKGALIDRVVAIRNTMVFAPRFMHHSLSGIRLLAHDGPLLHARSQFAIHQTLGDGSTHLQMVGRSFDSISLASGAPLFTQRLAIFDTELIPGSVVYPI